jgi:transcription initiation factor TFIIIB Brf1 subunit/transcription initiation factor TFIIB
MECPNCGSKNIDQQRRLSGPIWCVDCGFKSKHKEFYNPFYKKEKK